MRPRGTVAGPLVLIVVGVLFLLHTISPGFRVWDFVARDWPFLLVLWGALLIVDISVRAIRGRPLPTNGISGGGWVLVILICCVGWSTYEVRRPDNWWRRAGFDESVEAFGEGHEYSIPAIQKAAGKTPHVVIESFRGDAKIAGTDGSDVLVGGHKTIQSFDEGEADRANGQTPVEMTVQGDTLTIRCNQDKSNTRARITSDLEISVPKGASVEVTGIAGDFDVASIDGDVDLSSDNAGVHVENVSGNVRVDTRHSDAIRCTNVKGAIDLRGHGTDVDLETIAGQVTINGEYGGAVTLREIAKPVRIENLRTELDVQKVTGEIRLDRGSLSMEDVVGPVKLTTRSTDVTLNGFTDALEMVVEKGDVDLKPDHLPLGKMIVHTRSGNIELALPESAAFALTAATDHGEIENEFGDALKERAEGRGARLQGSIGSGPDLSLITDRGTITVRKANSDDGSGTSASNVSLRAWTSRHRSST